MDNFVPRKFQQEAFDAFFEYYKSGKRGNIILALFTGLGKSYVIAMIICEMLRKNKKLRVLVVCHSESVLSQDFKAMYDLICFYNIFATLGVYSAKLGKKETNKQITFCTIGSVYKNKTDFNDVKYMFIDEAHMVGTNEKSMYRLLIDHVKVPICGLTGTPYRAGKGYLHTLEGGIFNDMPYSTNTSEKFAEAIELGYLVKPVRSLVDVEMNVDKIKKTAGDFNLKGLSLKLDRDELTQKICSDILKYKSKRKHLFVMCIDKKHCENVSNTLNKLGMISDYVHSSKEEDTDIAIQKFKTGEIQALTSVMMLTVGFDYPDIDVVCLLRPTSSINVHVQGIGRGLRSADNKENCLVLDYAGNVARNGPIDNPIIKVKGKGKKGGDMEKTCPSCELKHHISVRICECGHEFTFNERLEINSGELSIIKEKVKVWRRVDDVNYYTHSKPGKPDSLRIEYLCGLRRFPMWITLYHGGSAGRNSNHVFGRLKKESFTYNNINDIISNKDKLRMPSEIYVDETEKYPHIEDFKFEEVQ